MLAKALEQANTAVLLDNAQNFEGAVDAYGDACSLLQQVMIRSAGAEDRQKLDAVVRAHSSPDRVGKTTRTRTGGRIHRRC